MAKIDRLNGNVEPFGSDATITDRTVFGSPSEAPINSDTLDGNVTADYLTGWGILAPSAKPPKQYFNGAMYTATLFISYLHQMGVAEWNANQEYQINSVVQRNGVFYFCNTADHTSVTAPESDAINWDSFFTRFDAYGKSNILGTVSQSGGVPAGAIIERGSNANGEYVKFADGYMVCTGVLSLSGSIANASNAAHTVTMPATFINSEFTPSFNLGINNIAVFVSQNYAASASTAAVILRNDSGVTRTYEIVGFSAIGRWF